MKVRLKGFIFLVIGIVLIYISLIIWTGIIPWILGIIGVHFAIWMGLVRIIKGEKKSIQSPQLVRDKLIEPVADSVTYCSSCGTEVKSGYVFCAKCGEPVKTSPSQRDTIQDKCPSCGFEIQSSNIFCENCGKKIG